MGSSSSTGDSRSHGPTTPDSKEPEISTCPTKTGITAVTKVKWGICVWKQYSDHLPFDAEILWDFPSHWRVPSTLGFLSSLSSVYTKNTSTHTYIERCLSHHLLLRWSPEPQAWPKPSDGRGAKMKSLVSWREAYFAFLCLMSPEQLHRGYRIAPN